MVVRKKPKTNYSKSDHELFVMLKSYGWKTTSTPVPAEVMLFYQHGYWIRIGIAEKQVDVFLDGYIKLFSFYSSQADINPVASFLASPIPGAETNTVDPKSLKPQLIKY